MSLPLRSRTVYRTVAQKWCNVTAWSTVLISSNSACNMTLRENAPVAQLDRALVSGTKGRRFESSQARHNFQGLGADCSEPFSFPSHSHLTNRPFLVVNSRHGRPHSLPQVRIVAKENPGENRSHGGIVLVPGLRGLRYVAGIQRG